LILFGVVLAQSPFVVCFGAFSLASEAVPLFSETIEGP
jgi:hypothetical protein